MSVIAKMEDGKERMERRLRASTDLMIDPVDTPGVERKIVNLTGKIIRQLPLPPRDAALERPRSGRGDSILPLLPIE